MSTSLEAAITTEPNRGEAATLVAESAGLARPTSGQQVADHIRRMIFTNELRGGERVPQDELAAQLGVSRVPVREAIIALDREGWVTNEAHRGAFVNGLDEATVLDHYEYLGMLYGFAARRATESAPPAGVKHLVELNRQFQAADDPAVLWDLSNAYLRLLVDLTNSRRIVAMARLLTVNIMPGNYFADVPGAARSHKKGLRATTRAIKAGDGDAARDAFLTMTRAEAAAAVSLLRSRGQLA